MGKVKELNIDFQKVISKLGFDVEDDCLYLTENKKELSDPQIQFHIEKAKELNASAVYLRRQLNGSYKPQVYLFDYTDRGFNEANEDELADIQTNIWSSGEAPLACIFHNTSIQIIDCTKHITKNYKPEYLVKDLKLVGKVSDLYNNQFAIKIKSGIFWEQEELKNKFKFQNSAYDKLIDNIRFVANKLTKEFKNVSTEIVNKIIVQAILIKYLEERIDDNGNKLLSNKYFQKYNKASSFNDVLKQQGKFVELLSDLNKDFNGNVFKWEAEEEEQLKVLNLTIVADLLATDKTSLGSEQLELDFPDRDIVTKTNTRNGCIFGFAILGVIILAVIFANEVSYMRFTLGLLLSFFMISLCQILAISLSKVFTYTKLLYFLITLFLFYNLFVWIFNVNTYSPINKLIGHFL